ncbi:MAG: PAS domain-containing protein [Spirochaetia bacterium]|nr:PAS domain-containing protein [Spirochaetia bacterium]
MRHFTGQKTEGTWTATVEGISGFNGGEFNREVSSDIREGMIHPDDRVRVFEKFEAVEAVRGKFQEEYRFRCKSGEYVYLADDGIYLPDEDKKTPGCLAS